MNRRGGDRCAAPAAPARPPGLCDERGAAAVEMALVLPLLLLLLFGIIDFGRLLNAQIILTEAAREGARAAALHLDPSTRITSAAGGVALASTTVTTCGGNPSADAVAVLTHSFAPVTPVGPLMGFFGGDSDGSLTITARGVMPCVG